MEELAGKFGTGKLGLSHSGILRKRFASYRIADRAASYRVKGLQCLPLCMSKNPVMSCILTKLANTICVVRFLLADVKIVISLILFSGGRTELA